MAINRSAAYRPAALIPVYNHPATVEAVVSTLIRQKIPVIVVDDGSDAPAREACDRCARLGAALRPRRAQQPPIGHAARRTRRANVFAGLHGIGVGGIYAKLRPRKHRRHLLRRKPAAQHRDPRASPLCFSPVGRGNAHGNGMAQRRQLMGKRAALGGAAENKNVHCVL